MLLGDIVRLNAQKAPGRTALIVDDREISFGTLHERMLRLANALLGVASKGDRVGILAENVPEYVEAYYGVPTAGHGAHVPELPAQPEGVGLDPEQRRSPGAARRPRLPPEDRARARRDRLDRAHHRHRRLRRRRPQLVRRLRRRGAGQRSLRSRSTRTTPRGSSTRAARPGSPRERCSPTATSWRLRSSR